MKTKQIIWSIIVIMALALIGLVVYKYFNGHLKFLVSAGITIGFLLGFVYLIYRITPVETNLDDDDEFPLGLC